MDEQQIVDNVPAEFVCFSQHNRLPRKFRKEEHDSFNMFVWSGGQWRFHDNVSEATATSWFRSQSEVYVCCD